MPFDDEDDYFDSIDAYTVPGQTPKIPEPERDPAEVEAERQYLAVQDAWYDGRAEPGTLAGQGENAEGRERVSLAMPMEEPTLVGRSNVCVLDERGSHRLLARDCPHFDTSWDMDAVLTLDDAQSLPGENLEPKVPKYRRGHSEGNNFGRRIK